MQLAREIEALKRRLPVVRRRSYDRLAQQYATWYPAGHFYSPYPDMDEFEACAPRVLDPSRAIAGVDMNERGQVDLARQLVDATDGPLPFPIERSPEFRYFFDNDSYSWADGTVLNSMLRHLKPARIVEVGSGYSSAMILDTVDRWLGGPEQTHVTLVEPYPEVLGTVLRPDDVERVDVVHQRVQEVDLGVFEALEDGDLLFIDSTHVSKVGSDVNHLFFEVIPRLAVGVHVHVHDIFMPFEYPGVWVREGRAWQEAYILRAFLSFNPAFEVRWFQDFMWHRQRDLLMKHWPEMAKNGGGNFWMQRVA